MLFASFAELASIGAVIPFLGVLTSPNWLFENPLAQPLIKLLGYTEPSHLLKPLTVLFVTAAIVSGGMRLLLNWAQTRLGHAIGADFSARIYRHTLYQPYLVHLMRNSSVVISGITNKADGLVNQSLLPTFVITSSMMMLISILIALITFQPIVSVIAIVGFGGIYATAIASTRGRIARESNLINYEQTQIIKTLQESLGGIRDVIIDATQETYCQIFEKVDRRIRRAGANIGIVAISPRFIVEALSMSMIATLAYVLAGLSGGMESAIPILGALALAAQRMLPVLQQVYSNWTVMNGSKASFIDALELLDQPLPISASESKLTAITFQRDIVLESIGFKYEQHQQWILRELNLTIPKGSRIGFIGATGSGKSTLLDILMGLLEPNEGQLKIDGVPITQENYRSWQKHIAHVPQSIFLTDTSIAENIAFGVPKPQIDYARVYYAAEQAQIAQTIDSWAAKYETKVGERGVRLSGGQRQRIGIARALYKQADVLVFDEATSALDSETENEVIKAINKLKLKQTILMVAHRVSTLKDCDMILELSGGQIKQKGAYSEFVMGLK